MNSEIENEPSVVEAEVERRVRWVTRPAIGAGVLLILSTWTLGTSAVVDELHGLCLIGWVVCLFWFNTRRREATGGHGRRR